MQVEEKERSRKGRYMYAYMTRRKGMGIGTHGLYIHVNPHLDGMGIPARFGLRFPIQWYSK